MHESLPYKILLTVLLASSSLQFSLPCHWPNVWLLPIDNIHLLHDNAWPHTSIRTREIITSFRWTTLPHPPYSSDLAPSDYHLFGLTKEGLRAKYADGEEAKTAVMKWLKEQSTGESMYQCIFLIANEKNGDYVEK